MILFLFLISISPLSDSLFDRLEKIDYFSSTYEETILDTLTETIHTFRGKIYLARPYYFRMDISYPEDQLLICDGKFLWLYLPEDSATYQISLDDPNADIPRPDQFIFGSRDEYSEIDILRSDFGAVFSFRPIFENRFFNQVDISVTLPDFSINYLKIFSSDYGERTIQFIENTESYEVLPESLFIFNY